MAWTSRNAIEICPSSECCARMYIRPDCKSPPSMLVTISFYSYFKDLTGCAETTETLQAGSTIEDLLVKLGTRFPQFAEMQKSFLIAVGVDYQNCSYVLNEGDQVSFFPPVQGG